MQKRERHSGRSLSFRWPTLPRLRVRSLVVVVTERCANNRASRSKRAAYDAGCHVSISSHTRLRVRLDHPAFPAPSAFRGTSIGSTRDNSCRGNENSCLTTSLRGARDKIAKQFCAGATKQSRLPTRERRFGGLPGEARAASVDGSLANDDERFACPGRRLRRQLAASNRSSVSSRIAASGSSGSPKAKPCAYSQPNW